MAVDSQTSQPEPSRTLHVASFGALHGDAPRCCDFTLFWTPLLGPAAAAVHHALALLAPAQGCVDVDVDTVGAALGLRPRRARMVVPAALERLDRHGLCHLVGDSVLIRAPGPLPAHMRRRLPARWIAAAAGAGSRDCVRGILGT